MLPARFTPLLPVSEANAGASLHPPLTIQLWKSAVLDTRRMSYSHRAKSIFQVGEWEIESPMKDKLTKFAYDYSVLQHHTTDPILQTSPAAMSEVSFSIILTSGFRVMPWWHDVSVSNWQSWGEQWSQEGKESWHWSLATHRAFVRQVGVMNWMGWFGFNLNLGQAVHSTSLPLQARLPATIQAVSWKHLRPGWFFGMQHAELMAGWWSNSFYTSVRCPVDLWQQWTCLFFSPTPQKN